MLHAAMTVYCLGGTSLAPSLHQPFVVIAPWLIITTATHNCASPPQSQTHNRSHNTA